MDSIQSQTKNMQNQKRIASTLQLCREMELQANERRIHKLPKENDNETHRFGNTQRTSIMHDEQMKSDRKHF